MGFILKRAFLCALFLSFAPFLGVKADAATLRTDHTIMGETLTLGDVFTGLDKRTADRPLGAAPFPGEEMVLNARSLLRIAQASGIKWQPAHAAEKAVIRRAATIIDKDTIKTAVQDKLAESYPDALFHLSFDGNEPRMVLPPTEKAGLVLSAFSHNPAYGRFQASFLAPSAERPLVRLHVQGNAKRMVSVPVLRETLRVGEIIGARDLDWVEVESHILQRDVLLKEKDLTGLTPRRLVQAGRPIRASEVERPLIVERGEVVTIVYNEGPLLLTARGKALQNGAQGDPVRVVNTSGNRKLDAFVTGDGEVTVER